MKKYQLKFTTSAPNRKGKLSVSISRVGCAQSDRSYMTVQGLKDPNYHYWNNVEQRFTEPTVDAIANNDVLAMYISNAEKVEELNPATSKLFCELMRRVMAGIKIQMLPKTVKDCIEEYIANEKKAASTNYQLYETLLHNLMGVETSQRNCSHTFPKPMCDGVPLIEIPISEIDNRHFGVLAKWIKDIKGGRNYRNLMQSFRRIVSVAQNCGLNHNSITFKPSSEAPKKQMQKQTTALTKEQIRMIEESGASPFFCGGRKVKNHELYIDAVMLMYYTWSRDADVLRFHNDMLSTASAGKVWLSYLPYKKRNKGGGRSQIVLYPLCSDAMAIINKYKDRSKGGYLLPFPFNDQRHDLSKKCEWDEWQRGVKYAIACLNKHLQRVGASLGIKEKITVYSFRRSAITHAVEENKLSIAKIAQRAGTSIEMIQKHYLFDNDAMESQIKPNYAML